MAPKSRPKLARFVFTVGMVLAMALITSLHRWLRALSKKCTLDERTP